ncbi:integrin beta-1-like [Scomber japonicus]|uniref:integrin beta-1-like n=1 Tax=Scomber japonicus TaxID=13676 RepID=UPI0023050BDD|nr:integrin beta-1-like [Scomber japonicus]XP_053182325.1 integrin beta-1-like [Scomber japonicus]
MTVKLLCLSLLLALPFLSWAKKQTCQISASNCNECIQSGPECAWCNAPYAHTHCHTLRGLQRQGCPEHHIYNPRGGMQVVRNDSSTEPVIAQALLLQPQELSLHLRPGVSQSFPLTITMPTDQPITELTMDTSPVPAGVNITFSSIMEGNPLVTQVSVEAAQCHSGSDNSNQDSTGPWSVHITPRGFSLSVKLEISLECQCDCMKSREENSPICSGNGALVCGQCECSKPNIGQYCQRESDSIFLSNEDRCRSGPNAIVCSGRGECEDGYCICNKRTNPEERITGQYCECTNYDCPYANARICGGHGKCVCGQCVCDYDWTGEDCTCSMDIASCMATNQKICNWQGNCQCGVCQCPYPYGGPTCETCFGC